MVTKSILENSLKGTRPFPQDADFPVPESSSQRSGVNQRPGDPNYDLFQLALKSTAKRLYPNYVNCDWSNDGTPAATEKEKKEILDSLQPGVLAKLSTVLKADPSIAERLRGPPPEKMAGVLPAPDGPSTSCSTMGCRTYNRIRY